ncbi:NAD kinase [Chryseomicrobium palamuruense]|uniref:NAD kinase n=1 Tax=Chryseomicrobium palamuruense TaxID=682973 RepID=A0ABV8UY46_9BACL
MKQRNALYIYAKNDEASQKIRKELGTAIDAQGLQVVGSPEEASIIVSVGSDGSFLQAVRKTGFRQDVLYAGISTSGILAMYCDFLLEELHFPDMTDAIIQDRVEVRKYPIIEVSINEEPKFYCLNEFSIRSNIMKTIAMDVKIDGTLFETFRGDGLVVSTPTGSSAYNKSLHGAVVDPQLPCFQVTEVASMNNNEFRSLGSPFILSGNRSLRLELHEDWNDYPTMSTDNEALSIQHVNSIDIRLSEHVVKTVKLKDNSYWEKVKRSFL